MAELNLKQITDKLNAEFAGDVRKLVFWYDAGAEFAGDVDALGLENAKVLHLAPDNQFYTKYFWSVWTGKRITWFMRLLQSLPCGRTTLQIRYGIPKNFLQTAPRCSALISASASSISP